MKKVASYNIEVRDNEGVTCSGCGCKDHYWKNDKLLYQCKSALSNKQCQKVVTRYSS